MNAHDERLKIPPPPGCLTCGKRESVITMGVARHWCREGHPMHELCGFYDPATEGQMHRYGKIAATPMDAAPWEG